ncbi:MAG: hypothetical protein K2G45_03395 [Lachnospiraceae bacterium]|nr:hypothetical protein [Lachnospiraceae bacterium]
MADSAVSGIISNSHSYIKGGKKETPQNELDKDAFLQLLVTQMQYQDPLNPGDSTEYMSQLAQYSSLEATMNISNTLEKGNALNLVGEYVIMNTTNASGATVQISGLVEYATVKDGDVLLSINDTYYPAEDLDSVVDYDYYLFLQEQAKKAAEESGGENNEGGDDKGSGGVDKTE